MFKSLILCSAFLIYICFISALVEEYTFVSGMGTYTQIAGGTVLGSSTNDENSFNDISIGFDFVFDFALYNNISVNTNGFMVFGSTAQNSSWAISNANANASNHVVAALNRDLKSKTTGSLMYKLIGTAPNRIFVMQWTDYQRYGGANSGDTLNFQIKLHETSNMIEIQYGHIVFGNSNLVLKAFQVGLRGNSSLEFNNRKVIIGLHTWSTSTAGTLNTDHCELSPTFVPPTGFRYIFEPPYSFLPPQANAVMPLNNAVDVPINTSLTWTSGPGDHPSGYLLYFGTDNPPTNLLKGTNIGLQTSYIPSSNLSKSTTYYWQIIPYNQYGNALFCPIWSFTTQENHITIDISQNIVSLSWAVIPNADSYIVEGSNQVDFGFSDISTLGNFTNIGNTIYWKTNQLLPYHFYRMRSVVN